MKAATKVATAWRWRALLLGGGAWVCRVVDIVWARLEPIVDSRDWESGGPDACGGLGLLVEAARCIAKAHRFPRNGAIRAFLRSKSVSDQTLSN